MITVLEQGRGSKEIWSIHLPQNASRGCKVKPSMECIRRSCKPLFLYFSLFTTSGRPGRLAKSEGENGKNSGKHQLRIFHNLELEL